MNCGNASELVISASTLSGETCSLRLDRSSTVLDVKRLIWEQLRLAVDRQRLLVGTTELIDNEDLATFTVMHGENLTVVLRTPEQVQWLNSLRHGIMFAELPAEARADRNLVLEAMQHGFFRLAGEQQEAAALKAVSVELQGDSVLVLELVRRCGGDVLKWAATKFQADRSFLLQSLTLMNGLTSKPGLRSKPVSPLQYATVGVMSDRNFVLDALHVDSGLGVLGVLPFIAEVLLADYEIAMTALQIDSLRALPLLAQELLLDRRLILEATTQNGKVIEMLSSLGCGHHLSDREIVLTGVGQAGYVLQFVSASLCADREVVVTAVESWGEALAFAAEEFRAEHAVVLLAVRNDGMSLQHAADTLRADRTIVLAAVSQNGAALVHAAKRFRSDMDVALAAVGSNAIALNLIAEDLLSNSAIAMAALKSERMKSAELQSLSLRG
eukprot:TRINITY_DN108730_c0_g1_i1.p1 TRINITY_DN108730_c0_g1~~TRINITY_DN108730_c0_g1_i1.p1  ORF type:complete len:489 (-),score=68.61 TRINITY_DN108730_c0_g1_i1:74-1399(-)